MTNFWQKLSKPILALAPMAGYTDSAFRQICRNFGADVVYSEMISVDAICFNNPKTLAMLTHSSKEYPLVIQLFGNHPAKFAQAVKIINQKIPHYSLPVTRPLIGIDINFGCPAHKVTKNGSGAALMNELKKSFQIIEAVCGNTHLPVSIKIRSKVKDVDALKFLNYVKNLPWQTVMLHGRTLTQGFNGPIDFEIIKKAKHLLPQKIVLANGNIHSPFDIQATLQKTKADGVGIARAALGNPWIFASSLSRAITPQAGEPRDLVENPASLNNLKQTILNHATLALKYLNDLQPLRKHLVHYTRGLKNARDLRTQLVKVKTLSDLKSALKSFA